MPGRPFDARSYDPYKYERRVAAADSQILEEWDACPEAGQYHDEVVAVRLPIAYLQWARQAYVVPGHMASWSPQ